MSDDVNLRDILVQIRAMIEAADAEAVVSFDITDKDVVRFEIHDKYEQIVVMFSTTIVRSLGTKLGDHLVGCWLRLFDINYLLEAQTE